MQKKETDMADNSPYLWWKNGVIYQIYPRSFQDSNGDGIGDLEGVIQRLDYLTATLGVDAIWLSPFYPSPMADFGYDVSNYTDVDAMFGDLAIFDHLVAMAHQRNLQVIIDFVPNHTSDQHPWFIASRQSRTNHKRSWYVWRSPRPDGTVPNNWLSVFGGTAWEFDEKTGQYYLHSFLKEQPDLNWRNPRLKEAMFDAIRFWLNRGVDGFRLDVAHYIMKDPGLRDNPVNPHPENVVFKAMGDYDSLIHLYDKGHPDVHAVFREFRHILDDYSRERPRFSIGEIHVFDWKKWCSYYGENLDELHMPFNFSLMGQFWDLGAMRQVIDSLEGALPAGAWPNYVLGNHDEPRLGSRYGVENIRLAAMLLLTLRGTPTIYYGEELGMVNVQIPAEKEQDPWGKRVPGLGRDPNRTPMQWDASANAGFSTAPQDKLWLPLAPDYGSLNVQSELADPHSVLNLYRKLIQFRKDTPALYAGSYRSLDGFPEESLVFIRQSGEKKVLVVLNSGTQPFGCCLTLPGQGHVAVSTGLNREGELVRLDEMVVAGKEGLIIEMD
jgi:alpha-glucosidase